MFFYIYLFSIIILGSFYVGPASIRVYMTIIMMLYLFINKKNFVNSFRLPSDFVKLFVIYVFITGLTLMLNGEISESDYPKRCFAYFIPSIVTYYAFDYHIKNTRSLYYTAFFLFFILFLDCSITILQHIGNPIGKALAIFFSTSLEEQQEIASDSGIDSSRIFGEGYAIGLFKTTFTNANWIACLGIIIIGTFFCKMNNFLKIVLLFLLIVVSYAGIATQGRAPIGMFFILVFYLLLRSPIQPKIKVSLFAFFIFVFLSVLPLAIENEMLGRIGRKEGYEEDSRDSIWPLCVDFILSHPLLGGPVSYNKIAEQPPHNYFLYAFIQSGLAGGLLAIFIYIKVLLKSIEILFKKHMMITYSIAASILIYMVNSLFHNASIIIGDTLFFIIFPLMLKSLMLEKNDKINEKSNMFNSLSR